MPQVAVPLPNQTPEAEQSASAGSLLVHPSIQQLQPGHLFCLPACLEILSRLTSPILILSKGYGQLQLEKLPSC